jgi:undecaprenyl pyrophosphate phosphatase UppP
MNPVYLRLGLYVLSSAIAAIPAAYAGLITYDMARDVLTMKPMGIVSALVGGGAISGGIFAKWGTK